MSDQDKAPDPTLFEQLCNRRVALYARIDAFKPAHYDPVYETSRFKHVTGDIRFKSEGFFDDDGPETLVKFEELLDATEQYLDALNGDKVLKQGELTTVHAMSDTLNTLQHMHDIKRFSEQVPKTADEAVACFVEHTRENRSNLAARFLVNNPSQIGAFWQALQAIGKESGAPQILKELVTFVPTPKQI